MAKKSNVKKISDEHLKSLQEINHEIHHTIERVGTLELDLTTLQSQIDTLKQQEDTLKEKWLVIAQTRSELATKFTEIYGSGLTIDQNTGEIKKIEN